MVRRKSEFLKWTLALVLVLCSSVVFSRPQDSSTTSFNTENAISTEKLIRYKYEEYTNNTPIISILNNTTNGIYNSNNNNSNNNNNVSIVISNQTSNINEFNYNKRRERLLKQSNNILGNNRLVDKNLKINAPHLARNNNKSLIKKLVTKWTDVAQFEDLNFSKEVTKSQEIVKGKNSHDNKKYSDEYSNIENTYDLSDDIANQEFVYTNKKKIPNRYHRPQSLYSEEAHVNSNNVQVLDSHTYPHVRPSYIFPTPTPTPIITNAGYPSPWQHTTLQNNNRPTKKKPVKNNRPVNTHNYHTNYHHTSHPNNDFEVTTLQPSPIYTDRIVIRPEEYSASPDDCPTIFLTLNNTFQGEGKEACPDLNIAVNTNVINKNVAVSDENTDTTLTDIFGSPFAESASEEGEDSDYTDSNENQEQSESASVEGLSLANYNEADVSESDSTSAPSNALAAIKKPHRPYKKKNELFGFTSIFDFFRPLTDAYGWLASISPFSFTALSFLLTPAVIIFTGISGITSLFSPWIGYGREAAENPIDHPYWKWDDYYKTWYLDSYPANKNWLTEPPLNNLEINSKKEFSFRVWLLSHIKKWLQAIASSIKTEKKSNSRKYKTKKR